MEANSTIAQKILAGDLSDFPQQATIINELLTNLKKLPSVKNFSCEMTDEEFIEGMRHIAEGKSSSHSGRHYSLYKALLAFPFTTNIMVNIVNQCVSNNIILKRWKKIIQVMICKYRETLS